MPPAPVPRSLWSSLPRDLIVSVPFLACFFFSITERGPWLWLVELQLLVLNAYFPSYTFAAFFLIAIVGSIIVNGALDGAGWRAHSYLMSGMTWVLGLPAWLSLPFVTGMILLAIALWNYVPLQFAGPRTQVLAADLENGTTPGSRWLVIDGNAPAGLSVQHTEKGKVKHIDACFVSPNWQRAQPVAVVLTAKTAAELPTESMPTTIEGTASPMGVPGLTRSALEAAGITIASDAVYVEVGVTPANAGSTGPTFAAIGAGLMIGVLVIAKIRSAVNRPALTTSATWTPGQEVAVRWPHDGYYYAGVILEADRGEYHIQFADGDVAWATPAQLVVLDVHVGMRVEALWNGGDAYYPGAITQIDGPTLGIRYDDNMEEWVTLSVIRF